MTRIVTDLKTTPSKIAAEAAASDRSRTDAQRKVRIHMVCILLAGTVSCILFSLHIGDPMTLGFGPIAPSIVQEIFDRIFRL